MKPPVTIVFFLIHPEHDVTQVNAVGDAVQCGHRRLARGFLVDDGFDLAAPAVAPVVRLGRVRVDGDMKVLGGPSFVADDLAQPLVVAAGDLNVGGAVVVGDLFAVPGFGQLDARDELMLFIPEPDQWLGDTPGFVGVAAVEELLLDGAELRGRHRGHEMARS